MIKKSLIALSALFICSGLKASSFLVSPNTINNASVTGLTTDSSTTTYTGQNNFQNGIEVSTKSGNTSIFSVAASSVSTNGPTYIYGSNTNDTAPSGFVGEYLSSVTVVGQITAVGATTVFVNVAQLTLTAGSWLLTGQVITKANSSATWTLQDIAISVNSGNTTTDQLYTVNELYNVRVYAATDQESMVVPNYRLAVSNGTTQSVFLKVAVTYASGTPQVRSAGLFAVRYR